MLTLCNTWFDDIKVWNRQQALPDASLWTNQRSANATPEVWTNQRSAHRQQLPVTEWSGRSTRSKQTVCSPVPANLQVIMVCTGFRSRDLVCKCDREIRRFFGHMPGKVRCILLAYVSL